jgi:hypothetical protein
VNALVGKWFIAWRAERAHICIERLPLVIRTLCGRGIYAHNVTEAADDVTRCSFCQRKKEAQK